MDVEDELTQEDRAGAGVGRDAERGRVAASAAAVYEELFVPALFGQWPERVLDVAGAVRGESVADVACGTGVLARAASRRVGPTGSVVGIDVNEAMLDVARRAAEPVRWQVGAAEALPLADASVDRAVCQFGVMFFDDREAAIREMARATRRDGTVTVATWADLSATPGYAAMVDLLERLFGETVADALRAPFVLGDADVLHDLVAGAEPRLAETTVTWLEGSARFPSLDTWVRADIRGWTLADMIDDAQFARLLAAARDDLSAFVRADGEVRFAAPALVATGVVRA